MQAYYDFVGHCWRLRFGTSLVDIAGVYHWASLADLKVDLYYVGLTLCGQQVVCR